MRLSGLHLRVPDPQALARFYVDHLGMSAEVLGDTLRIGYPGQDADLVLHPGAAAYVHARTDRYWKIGITLPNVDIACQQLRDAGLAVSPPQQFLDIGYMCHLSDPQGFVIELLQHDFDGNRPVSAGDATLPLGGDARIGQITLRTGDIATDTAACAALGMRCLSLQPVAPHGFDLHFFAFTDDRPPNPDLRAVSNRAWLWKRPYTTLEFQHVAGQVFDPVPSLIGLEVEGLPVPQPDVFGTSLIPAP